MSRPDPVEQAIADALDHVGIRYVRDAFGSGAVGLDFYLPDFNQHIECKRFHTERMDNQMTRAPNVILVQGLASAQWLANAIRATGPQR